MDNQLENPVLKDSELNDKFLEAARLADQGQDIPADLVPGANAESPTATEPKAEKPEETNPDNSETDPDKKDERPRDELGRFTKTKDGKDIPESERQPAEKPKEEKPAATQPNQPSDYEAKKQERKQKEQERLEKTWENVNKRKEELEARQRELDEREARMRQPQQQAQPQPQQRQFSSQQLLEARNDFRAIAKRALDGGDYDAFNENIALADQAEQHAQQFAQLEAQEAQQAQIENLKNAWNGHYYKAVEANPDLKNEGSPLRKQFDAIMAEHGRLLTLIPNGPTIATDIAKLRLDAGSVSELREANKKLQAEVERLNALTGIGGSGPTSQPAKKKFEELSQQEKEERLMAAARAVDESRNY